MIPATEYEFEGVPGVPGHLPDGERVLWQGSPSWTHLAVRALHVRKVWAYFALLALWQVALLVNAGENWVTALGATWVSFAAAAIATAILSVIAWAIARATIYTITNKRVVLRAGVALPTAINIPFSMIENANVRIFSDGNGDLPLDLSKKERPGYFVLWPSVRPWTFSNPQPMLRAIDDAELAGRILAGALAASADQPASIRLESARPVTNPSGHLSAGHVATA